VTDVLVVDDEAAVRRAVVRIVERMGLPCAEAADVAEARRLADQREFTVVLCDVNMPGPSGLTLVRELRARWPDVAVLMVSALDDPRTAEVAASLGGYGYIVKPFETNEIVIAVTGAIRRRELEVENRRHREQLEVLVGERTAELAATVERLSEAEQALRASQEEAIRRLAHAAEFRDPTTGAHLSRMSLTSESLALACGLGAERAEQVRIASPMHDIGKIGIADDILRSTGKLSPAEMDEMRRHPLIGSAILAGSDSALLRLGGLIALTHHERWDGTGYPHRVAGPDIPIEGRIVAVADVFDALTSERPYKPAFSVDHAVSLMTEERGRHFDPELLDLFVASLDRLVPILP
jgi:putative two-component system response regulator